MPSTRRATAKQAVESKEKSNPTWGAGGLIQNRELGSLVLMILCPVFVLTFNYIIRAHDGSFVAFYNYVLKSNSVLKLFSEICPTPLDPLALKMIFAYSAFELFLMKVVPGKRFTSTITPTGHLPVYKANGLQCYTITIITVFALYIFDIFNPAIVYDNMGKLLSSMNMLALCLCAFLTVKGLNFPSTKDAGSNGSLIVDFFWGTELYPRVFGFDIKQFTNCRFGMMFWQVGILCYGIKQYETLGYLSSSMLVSIVVQTVYITKFFWWETGYFCTMDIQHDRAGYYLCWGCLVWVPSMYTIHSYFLVEHPVLLSPVVTAAMLVAGVFSVSFSSHRKTFSHPTRHYRNPPLRCGAIMTATGKGKNSALPEAERRFGDPFLITPLRSTPQKMVRESQSTWQIASMILTLSLRIVTLRVCPL